LSAHQQNSDAQQLQQELLQEAVRAYQRRLHMAYKMSGALLALKAVDDKLDGLVSAVASFGPLTLDHPSLRQAYEREESRVAAVYLRCALAAQMYRTHPHALEPVVKFHASLHVDTVAQALGSFPVGEHDFDFDCSHLVDLLGAAQAPVVRVAVMALGQRAGMSKIALLLGTRRRWYGQHSDELDGTLDLIQAQLGVPVEHDQWARNMQRHGVSHALQMLAHSGQAGRQVSAAQLVAVAQAQQGEAQEMAWMLALLADRSHALAKLAASQQTMEPPLCQRLWAFAGHWPELAQQFKLVSSLPLSSELQDVLGCSLGMKAVAAIAASAPGQLPNALREQVLKIFWRGHIDLHNQADTADWDSGLIVAQSMGEVQLRWGQCLPIGHGGPVQEQAYHVLSWRLRRALLWELRHWRAPRAVLGPGPLTHARLQMAWLQTQQDVAEATLQA
jgi:hypothetical protein